MAALAALFGAPAATAAPESAPRGPVKIGILGDVHGEREIFERALRQLRKAGVTHLIGTGDFVRWDGLRSMQTVLAKMRVISRVPRDRTYLMPGNWDHNIGFTPGKVNALLSRYGHLAFSDYDSYAVIRVGGSDIFVSHFPQHRVPEPMLPPPHFRRRPPPDQAYVMETLERGIHPPENASLGVFAHTHIGGAFVDPVSGVAIINPGVLNNATKASAEPLGYALFTPADGTIEFFDAATGQRTLVTSVPKLKESANRVACAGLFHLLASPPRAK